MMLDPTDVARLGFYGKLASEGRRLFRDADFAGLYCLDNGRPSVPPSLLALARLLQHYAGVSDAEVVERCRHDLRWKVALDLDLASLEAPFAKSTFQAFRVRLTVHRQEGLAFERSVKATREVGLLPKKLRGLADDPVIAGLLERQRPDGSWAGRGFYGPRHCSTFYVLSVLAEMGATSSSLPPLGMAVRRAAEFSCAFQAANGEFYQYRRAEGRKPSSLAPVPCVAIRAATFLAALRYAGDPRIGRAVDYLLSVQRQDGSWSRGEGAMPREYVSERGRLGDAACFLALAEQAPRLLSGHPSTRVAAEFTERFYMRNPRGFHVADTWRSLRYPYYHFPMDLAETGRPAPFTEGPSSFPVTFLVGDTVELRYPEGESHEERIVFHSEDELVYCPESNWYLLKKRAITYDYYRYSYFPNYGMIAPPVHWESITEQGKGRLTEEYEPDEQYRRIRLRELGAKATLHLQPDTVARDWVAYTTVSTVPGVSKTGTGGARRVFDFVLTDFQAGRKIPAVPGVTVEETYEVTNEYVYERRTVQPGTATLTLEFRFYFVTPLFMAD